MTMEIIRNTSYLCGHFSMSDWHDFAKTLNQSGWQTDMPGADKIANDKDLYHSEFVDFIHHNPDINSKKCKSKLDGMVRYKMVVDKRISLKINDEKTVPVYVDNIRFYLAPFNIVIFSIAVHMENVDYDDMSKALLMMRDVCHLNKKNADEFIKTVIMPVFEIYVQTRGKKEVSESVDFSSDELNFHMLAKTGNKLKLFQINEIADTANLSSAKFDKMLFDMGSLLPLSDDGADNDYYNKVISEGKVALCKEWRALAMFDSFTLLSSPVDDSLRNSWITEYYGLIYTYLLFCHAFLLEYDILFRAHDCDVSKLEEDIVLLERRFSFNRFSFNYLPLEIGRALERALEVQNCLNNLHHMVAQASGVYEKDSNEKMNNVLTFLAVITTCSTIWDLFSLLDAAFTFGYDGIGFLGFRIGVCILIIMMLMVYFVFKHSHKK